MPSATPNIDPNLMDPLFHVMWHKVVPILVAAIVLGTILRLLFDWTENKFVRWLIRLRDACRAEKSAPVTTDVPHCPICNRLMVERQAKRGAKAGRRFWGCSAYPDCRGTREMA
jgi:hypothetical protein